MPVVIPLSSRLVPPPHMSAALPHMEKTNKGRSARSNVATKTNPNKDRRFGMV